MERTDARKTVELPQDMHHLPPGSRAVGRTPPHRWIDVTVGLRRRKELPDLSASEKLLPAKRTYLTRRQLSEDYGPSPDAFAKVSEFARANRLTVTRSEPASARVGLGGTVADLSGAFGVTLFDYVHPELESFHARTGPVHLPAELAGVITGVFGFNNHRILRRRRRMIEHPTDTASRSRAWFVPTELADVYNFPPAPNLSSSCIALLEFGGGVSAGDVTAYFSKINLPAPAIKVVPLDGVSTDPQADPDSTGEVMLDIDVAGALASGAKLAVYFSTFDEKGLIDALSAVISDSTNDPAVVSISWGWDENQPFNQGVLWSPAAIDHINQSFLAAAQLGITVCVSTGDDGSEAQIKDGRAHVNFPATSPYVLAVGGTTLHARKDSTGRMQVASETVWNDGPGSGTGGGISDVTPVPSWQAGLVPPSINPGAFAGRAIPDVAANADPATGYLTLVGGKAQVVGGTSAAAPLWASLIARMNSILGARVGNVNALLYSSLGPGEVLRDITVGNNDTDGLLEGKFAAGPGWDACSGWGVPDGQKLLSALRSPGPSGPTT